MTAGPAPEEQAAAAYEWAASLVVLARRLVADGTEVDLSPIRPAIRDLCAIIGKLPAGQSRQWLSHLLELQHELAALGNEYAARRPLEAAGSRGFEASDDSATSTDIGGPACR